MSFGLVSTRWVYLLLHKTKSLHLPCIDSPPLTTLLCELICHYAHLLNHHCSSFLQIGWQRRILVWCNVKDLLFRWLLVLHYKIRWVLSACYVRWETLIIDRFAQVEIAVKHVTDGRVVGRRCMMDLIFLLRGNRLRPVRNFWRGIKLIAPLLTHWRDGVDCDIARLIRRLYQIGYSYLLIVQLLLFTSVLAHWYSNVDVMLELFVYPSVFHLLFKFRVHLNVGNWLARSYHANWCSVLQYCLLAGHILRSLSTALMRRFLVLLRLRLGSMGRICIYLAVFFRNNIQLLRVSLRTVTFVFCEAWT